MGGGDKTLLLLDGRPMLLHVIDRISPQIGPLAVNANGDPDRFAPFGRPVVPDEVEGFPGRLPVSWQDWNGSSGIIRT